MVISERPGRRLLSRPSKIALQVLSTIGRSVRPSCGGVRTDPTATVEVLRYTDAGHIEDAGILLCILFSILVAHAVCYATTM